MKPTVDNPIKVFLDGDSWCALLGEDLQSGEAAFGDTAIEALFNFLSMPPLPVKEEDFNSIANQNGVN